VSGPIEMWHRLLEVRGERVLYEIHYLFLSSGEELVSTNELSFRTQVELTQSLTDLGFSVEHGPMSSVTVVVNPSKRRVTS